MYTILVPNRPPQLSSRLYGEQKEQMRRTYYPGPLYYLIILVLVLLVMIQGINQFHNRADGSVKIKPLFNIFGHLFDGEMSLVAQFLLPMTVRQNWRVLTP